MTMITASLGHYYEPSTTISVYLCLAHTHTHTHTQSPDIQISSACECKSKVFNSPLVILSLPIESSKSVGNSQGLPPKYSVFFTCGVSYLEFLSALHPSFSSLLSDTGTRVWETPFLWLPSNWLFLFS